MICLPLLLPRYICARESQTIWLQVPREGDIFLLVGARLWWRAADWIPPLLRDRKVSIFYIFWPFCLESAGHSSDRRWEKGEWHTAQFLSWGLYSVYFVCFSHKATRWPLEFPISLSATMMGVRHIFSCSINERNYQNYQVLLWVKSEHIFYWWMSSHPHLKPWTHLWELQLLWPHINISNCSLKGSYYAKFTFCMCSYLHLGLYGFLKQHKCLKKHPASFGQ